MPVHRRVSERFRFVQANSRQVQDARLLNEVFPERVAKQLREGKPVEPEQYDCCTIFFSDIVGFTDISRQLAPAEVMNMLNRLYQEFDAITRKHGLFKVCMMGMMCYNLCDSDLRFNAAFSPIGGCELTINVVACAVL